jgi:hypothetical protein
VEILEDIVEYTHEQRALKELLDSLEIIAKSDENLWEIESKMVLSEVMVKAFILQKDGYILPTTFGLNSKESNEAVRKALSNYIEKMSLHQSDIPERRWVMFQDLDVDSEEDNDVEDFFDWIEDLDDFR